ncbi:hypothetical protein CcCBS67573_g02011 [Chytriomyces confervae]|uniref:SH3 domain-containing protein n=1 Tax=Chytriomyces confervae TaxID=246404 RepID=A0A507FLZ7_9FUNG|nr:hypothetical protein HDU80_001528 [Chytriomyces hyalinus]TPX76730.1 hypothetical protein CcCBS67573_g02011 [Chytriomyces confervae]
MSTCFPLTGSTACPDLAGHSIVATSQISNLASFDAYVMQSLDSSAAFINGFQTTYGCPGFKGRGLRFHQSLMCNYFVSFSMNQCTAEQKSAATAYKPLCQSSCFAHINSVFAAFSDPQICTQSPTPQQNQARVVFMTSIPDAERTGKSIANSNVYYDSCYSMFNTNDTATCSQGLASDVNNAGFLQSADATQFCSTTSNSLSSIDKALCSGLGKSAAITAAGTGATGSPSGVSGLAGQLTPMLGINLPITRSQKLAMVLPARDAPWIISGLAWLFMTLGMLAWILYLKFKNWNNVSTMSVQPEGMSQLPERYKQMNEPDELYKVGTIARGRATLRRQAGGNDSRPKERKSVFESIFGGVVGGVRGKSGDSAYAPAKENRDDRRAVNEDEARRNTFADSEYQSNFDEASNYDREQSMYAPSNYDDDGQTDRGSYIPDDEGLFVKMLVVEAYEAQQADELSLNYGEILIIQETYDDGWASAQKQSTGAIGAVPFSCLADLGGKRPLSFRRRSSISQRASSYVGRR